MATFDSESAGKPAQAGQPFDYEALRSRLDGLLRKQLFFVGGLAKSGTTWVQLLLDDHPQVCCSGECHLVDRLFPALKGTLEAHNRFLAGKAASVCAELDSGLPAFELADLECLFATAILLLLAKRGAGKPALAVGEKTPENVQVFGALTRLFPKAKCIHVVRDPRDAAVSAWFHVERVMPDETRRHFADISQYLRYSADRWVSEVELG
ncbi:MAG: sulfotransferase family protein, partial [Acidobacteriota bacterium]